MSTDQAWTIGRLLEWTTGYFREKSASSPRLDAEVLLAEARGCNRIDLYTTYDQPADESCRERFRELVRRRAAGEPVAYLVGHREFYSIPFTVTRDVLIPRPETELLVVKLLDAAKESELARAIEIADVGTGSGVIAVCAARHLSDARVTAIDRSPAALAVARENGLALGVADQLEFVEGDLLECLPGSRQFDFVASNPPYVSSSELAALPDEIKRFEPAAALLAGETGTEVIARLIPQAAARLRSGGGLFVEISPMIEKAVLDLMRLEGRFEDTVVIKDLAGLPRVVTARRKAG